MNRMIWSVLVWLACMPAHAQTVYKCVSAGQARYQSAACPEGRTEQTWSAVQHRPVRYYAAYVEALRRELKRDAAARRGRQAMPAARRGRATAAPGVRGHLISVHRDPQACAAARQRREAAHRAAGLTRDLALSRRLDDAVFEACR
ncbi:DUF4124 domain-containing protein [Stenotrophomonas sp. NPDC077421]|uniref:DUF4124 domain-containing protein n=1 Tax=unclassified Stenotrophomonas TaxID=196198 RepID=UPI0013127714|nr:DUF4124 domain-containing protein [Stenotrophomonas sp.]